MEDDPDRQTGGEANNVQLQPRTSHSDPSHRKAIEFDLSSEMRELLRMNISLPDDLGTLLWLADAVKALEFFDRLLESEMTPEYRELAENARNLVLRHGDR